MRVLSAIIMISFLLSIQTLSAQNTYLKRFHQLSHQEIDQVIREISKTNLTVSEKINRFSELFLEMPYNLTCVGDGPDALLEPWPIVNFKETNCMAFCEHVLALSISDYWDNFFNNLQEIRYIDGLIGMKTRNHYTMADWLPQNSWILEDISKKVGGTFTKQLTRTISHKNFFAGKGMTDMSDVLPDRTMTVDYVPLDALDDIEANTKIGDICAILFAKKTDIFSAHMIMIAEKDGQKVIRESSNSKMTTFDTPYQEWVAARQKQKDKYCGVAFMRVLDELNTPGKIIKPWEIAGLKNK